MMKMGKAFSVRMGDKNIKNIWSSHNYIFYT